MRAALGDLALQLHQTVDERLGGRRAAGYVDVDGHDAIAAAHDRIAVVVIAAAVRARAHRHDVARFGHLVVDAAHRGRHLVGQRAGDDHQIALARRRARDHAETVHVVTRARRVHHLDRATREAERHVPEAVFLRGGHRGVERRDDEAVFFEGERMIRHAEWSRRAGDERRLYTRPCRMACTNATRREARARGVKRRRQRDTDARGSGCMCAD